MLQTSATLINRHDYEEMPQGPPYYQVIEGDLVMSPSPTTFHQHIIVNLAVIFRRFLEKKSLGEIFIAPLDVFLDEVNIYQPDVIFVSSQRRSIITAKGIEGAPDLIVEILSPSTAKLDKGSKRKIYARHGVRELWLVDPETQSIQVYLLTRHPETPSATHAKNASFESTKVALQLPTNRSALIFLRDRHSSAHAESLARHL
jgi:Uma2 family endonuclease